MTSPSPRRPVLVTGATGRIGSHFAREAADRYTLRFLVIPGDPGTDAIRGLGEIREGDLGELAVLKDACAGMDTVLHLAASPDPSAVWSELLQDNVVGCYHLFAAAKAAGCRRVVFASSIHAVSGYPVDVQVKTGEAVNPGDLYGVTKCFGEALGRYMADQEGLSTVCIRIGAFQPLEKALRPDSVGMLDAYVSPRDLQQLICLAIEREAPGFLLVHGLSDNRFKRLDISDARSALGYAPQDDLSELNPSTRGLHLAEAVADHSLRSPGQASGLREDL